MLNLHKPLVPYRVSVIVQNCSDFEVTTFVRSVNFLTTTQHPFLLGLVLLSTKEQLAESLIGQTPRTTDTLEKCSYFQVFFYLSTLELTSTYWHSFEQVVSS